ncbi:MULTISPECIES: alpha/beta hydrolase [unclassified Nocardia]|uniref:RBBP9/YdeN family alpha/beta hydrolase n=1 Tax=unclassified Nocardia TaxID=2637762 RepID=UPI001CE43041|nr:MULTISPECIES: alpha/beta hydrolase [unclassified Nocardia]
MDIYIVHGYNAGVTEHWFPWLAKQLRDQGHQVEVVELPTPSEPKRDEWEAVLAKTIGAVDANTLIVAHSLGTITALRHLASLESGWTLGGLVSVSGFTGGLEVLPELEDYMAEGIDVRPLVPHINARTMIHSDNDSIVPPSASIALGKELAADLIEIPGGGHFLGDEGFTELPEVLAAVERIAG